jgi:two-component system sensor histidine kinase RegB
VATRTKVKLRVIRSGATSDAALNGADTDLKNLRLLVQLRWLAIAGQLVTILVAEVILHIDLPLSKMAMTLGALLALNLLSLHWLRRKRVPSLAWVLMVDMLLLTAQLGLTGGGRNPFIALYLLQVTLAAVLLRPAECWRFVALTALLSAFLSTFHLPLRLPEYEPFFTTYLVGMVVALLINAVLIVTFVTRINRNLRDRDARLAALRQQAAEEDHIVRMGLLASGAAHELGTPLASISVILSDWRTIPATAGDAELQFDIAQMQKAVDRCKSIVSGILMSSGELRGEALIPTSVHGFVADVVDEWTAIHPTANLGHHNRFGPDMPILTDAALKQLVTTVLDNAHEVSPQWIGLTVLRKDGDLVLQVEDHGPGFRAGVLADFGKPYNSTKEGQGRGLGLFLVVNAIRKLGGDVTASNLSGGGALVTLTLPLKKLSVARGYI